MKMDKNRAGLALGITFAVYHLTWLIAVFLGFGSSWMSWSLGLHFISMDYELLNPNLTYAVIGILGVFGSGYVVGFLFAYIWEKLGKK